MNRDSPARRARASALGKPGLPRAGKGARAGSRGCRFLLPAQLRRGASRRASPADGVLAPNHGRNAWLDGPGAWDALNATAVVTFRERGRPLDLYGRCFERDDKPGLLRCGFVPGAFQSVLGQRIELEAAGEAVRATPSADWLVLRAGREPDGPYGPPATDDRVFLLAREPLAACKPSKALWGRKGAMPRLLGKLP